jgi:hypothetical protein
MILSRGAFVALALFAVVPVPSVMAQGYCPVWTDVLLDTSSNCVASPRRDRAFGVDTLTWGASEFLILNRGNEFSLYNINDPANPFSVASSDFDFGTRGDSDYDLVDFDVCDDCRFGVLAHKVKRTVIFDMGTGGTPTFPYPPLAWKTYEPVSDSRIGGVVFKKGSQQYLIAAELTDDCGTYSALYALNGVDNLNFLQCVEGNVGPIAVKKGQTLSSGGNDYAYLAESNGRVHVYEIVGSGSLLRLSHTDTPTGMSYRLNSLSIDEKNLLLASGDYLNNVVTFWDLTDPAHPSQITGWTISGGHQVSEVALRSPSPGSPSMLFTAGIADEFSTRTYLVSDSGPIPFDTTFWIDPDLPHNDINCHLAMAGALAPDGSALFLSRYTIHEVFDLSACLGPTEAVADVVVSPDTVFPGQSVTVADVSLGSYDSWAVWTTLGSSPDDQDVGGYPPPPSGSNPHSFPFTVPQNVADGEEFWAHVEVGNVDPPPQTPVASMEIGIDRTPQASFTVAPAAAITGDTVTLTATAEGVPDTYKWTITPPPPASTITRWGLSTDIPLTDSGDWTFDLEVNYLHTLPGGAPYKATATDTMSVTSVAADFSISPPSPLDTEIISLHGGLSSWDPSAVLVWEWQITPAPLSGWTCATEVCSIPEDTLEPDTDYTITLTLTNTDPEPDDVSVAAKVVHIGNGAVNPTFTWTPSSPEIGDTVLFAIHGLPAGVELDSVSWRFDNTGCDGGGAIRTCTPTIWDDCKAYAFEFSSGGNKDVSLRVTIGGTAFPVDGPYEDTVYVASTGSCGGGGGTCTYSISPSSEHFGAGGGTDSVRVTTQTGCDWAVFSVPSWVTITNGTSHAGSGYVYYRVDPNSGRSRSDGMSIAGRAFIVTQDAPYVPANFSMSTSIPRIGEVVTFTVDPILEVASWDFGDADCKGNDPQFNCLFVPEGYCNEMQWTYPTSGPKAVTMVLEDGRTQTKYPTVGTLGECCLKDARPDAYFTMSTSEAYTGETVIFTDSSSKALVSDKALAAVDFGWTPVDPEIGDNVLFTIEGLSDDVVQASWDFGDTGCDGEPAAQVCVSGLWDNCKGYSFKYASGGDKTVSVAIETAGGTINVGPHTVSVASTGTCETGGGGGGGGGCSYYVSPTSENFGPSGGLGSFTVNTTAECSWTATTAAGWLTLTTASGTGTGSVDYSVAFNDGIVSRTGTIRVEDKRHTVRQDPSAGDTEPTAWAWTVTLDDVVMATGNTQIFNYKFVEPGLYLIELAASNCAGTDTYTRSLNVVLSPITDFVLGAAVRLDGAYETRWETDFRFFNPCDDWMDVRIEYMPEGTNNSGEELVFREFSLAAAETKVFANIVEAIPDLADEELTGSVRIESTSASGCKVLSVSRTFNDTPDGSLGLFVPVVPVKAVGGGRLDFTGLISNASYRTNLRLVNNGDDDEWVALTILDRNGNPLAESRSVKVRGQSTKQVSEVAAWLGVTDDLELFSVRAETFTANVEGFTTVVDNISGDSVLNRYSFLNENKVWLVGVAHNFGPNGAQWRTDLWMYNPTPNWLKGEVEYVVGDSPDDRYGFALPTLGAGRVVRRLDLAGDLLGGAETRGYLVFEGENGGPAPQIAARTYNLDDNGGSYGLSLPTYGSNELLFPGETGFITGISNSADSNVGFRTNLGILNTDNDRWTKVRIVLYNLDGTIAGEEPSLAIAPGVMRQFDVFKKLGLDDVTMVGSIEVEVLSGGGAAVYATEIDNRTQDSIFIPGQHLLIGAVE